MAAMPKTAPSGRKASREYRREQLIEATIAAIAQHGLSRVTLGHVATMAGVSHGLVIFHFESKEKLLAETLRFMSEEHRNIWQEALRTAPDTPAGPLNALILAEFCEANQGAEGLSAWCAFWGEAQNRPLYLEQCADNDSLQIRAFEDACQRLVVNGGYDMDFRRAARVLRLTIEGVWLELMVSASPYPYEEAVSTAFFCASMLFPRHFNETGLISR